MALTSYQWLGLALAAFPLLSCGAMKQLESGLGDMLVVRATVAQKLKQQGVQPEEVGVNIMQVNGVRTLTVNIVNSPLTTESPERKRNVGREVADVAYQAYNSRARLKFVQVTYMVYHSYLLGMFHYSDSRDSITFPVN